MRQRTPTCCSLIPATRGFDRKPGGGHDATRHSVKTRLLLHRSDFAGMSLLSRATDRSTCQGDDGGEGTWIGPASGPERAGC